ncbi:hypothetical protein GCM10009799_49930 [Nocardiopsis rhodophaea]|uniref:EfeO-type cupredoxin-like domain-containing protein n=1 Tax=Nocardiopsis rhodophaea TaxID=280238 RepID=A0ABP5F766_9ACTN
MSRLALSAAALAVLLGVAACGGEGSEPAAGDNAATQQETGEGRGTAENDNNPAEDTATDTADAPTPVEAVSVKASEFSFEGIPDTLPAGTIKFDFDNVGEAEHNLVIEELGDTKVVEAQPGGQDSGTAELEPGEYTFYCSIPGHREAGMWVKVTVE